MRVLVTVPSLRPEFGGPALKARQLATALRQLGLDVIVAGGAGGVSDRRCLQLPVLTGFHSTPVPTRTRPLRRLVAGADIVHVIGFRDPIGTVAALAASRANVPYVVESVGMHRRRIRSLRLKWLFDRSLGWKVMRDAACIVATSRLESEELQEDGVDARRIQLRANGVDVTDLLPLPPRGTFRIANDIPPDVPLVLSLGRITAKKRLEDLMDAAIALEGVWLAIVGPDDGDGTLARLVSRASSLNTDRIRVVPRGAWGVEKAKVFADADVFCLPSATENFGNAVAEAASVGLPVIVSDRCGVSEWLDPAGAQEVPLGDVTALGEALTESLAASAKKAANRRAATLRDDLAWPALAARQLEIYAESLP